MVTEALIKELDQQIHKNLALDMENAILLAKVGMLREAVMWYRRYARHIDHHPSCPVRNGDNGSCECGYDDPRSFRSIDQVLADTEVTP